MQHLLNGGDCLDHDLLVLHQAGSICFICLVSHDTGDDDGSKHRSGTVCESNYQCLPEPVAGDGVVGSVGYQTVLGARVG